MLRAGFGTVDITPPPGCFLQGYFHPRMSEKIHDRLYANALVAENGSGKVCMVSCDLIGVSREVAVAARELMEEKIGIREDKIIICGTHTHTGPVIREKLIPDNEESGDEKWISILPSQICSAALRAADSMRKTGVACLSGYEDKVSFNRRFIMKGGSLKTNPGIGNQDILKPAGPIDPEVGVLAFGSGIDNLAGLVANFTMHPDTVAGNEISADFPGVIREAAGKFFGNAGFLYTSGAMGNINHIDVNRAPSCEYEYFEHAKRIGSIVGAEVIKTVNRLKHFNSDAAVNGNMIRVDLPLKKTDAGAVERARKALSMGEADLNGGEYMASVAAIRAFSMGEGEYETEITAIRIGDSAFVTMPGEYFVELGLDIKRNSPFPKTFVVELALDYLGYIAPRKAYEQGGYEPTSSPLAPGAGEILRDAALDLLGTLSDS